MACDDRNDVFGRRLDLVAIVRIQRSCGETARRARACHIEVLASYFASHVQQRWQFDRIQYQQSHDGLTGLINRSNFRSQARMAANASDRYAVILVDINAFRGVNETYGHMTGDALLVEVGAALRHRVTDDDIVGRVGDDVFGVFLANPRSKAFARIGHSILPTFSRARFLPEIARGKNSSLSQRASALPLGRRWRAFRHDPLTRRNGAVRGQGTRPWIYGLLRAGAWRVMLSVAPAFAPS